MKRAMKTLVLLYSAAIVVSCTSAKHKSSGGWLPGAALSDDRSVLLMRVPDAIEPGEGPAGGSGQAMTMAFLTALQQRGIKATICEDSTVATASEAARNGGFRYVLRVVFTTWEDNATTWSGRPDKAGMSAELYDATTTTLVATASHTEHASSVTFLGNGPDRFYPIIVQTIIDRLFGRGSGPARPR